MEDFLRTGVLSIDEDETEEDFDEASGSEKPIDNEGEEDDDMDVISWEN